MVIHDLDLTKRAKTCLYLVSLVGLLDIAISLIRFLNVELGDGSEFRSFSTIGKHPTRCLNTLSNLKQNFGVLSMSTSASSPRVSPPSVSFSAVPEDLTTTPLTKPRRPAPPAPWSTESLKKSRTQPTWVSRIVLAPHAPIELPCTATMAL